MKVFAERLKELREEKGLSMKKLGLLIGTSDATICRWEKDLTDIKGEEIVSLAKFFNVSTDYLLGLEN